MTGDYWFSCKQGSGYVKVKDKIIIDSCPLFRKFINQNFFNLGNWAKGDIKWLKIK